MIIYVSRFVIYLLYRPLPNSQMKPHTLAFMFFAVSALIPITESEITCSVYLVFYEFKFLFNEMSLISVLGNIKFLELRLKIV